MAGEFPKIREEIQALLASQRLRIYSSRDMRGVEIAAAATQPIAAAFGLSDLMEYGPSVRGMLMARGVAEIARMVEMSGGEAKTAFGMAGLGSLATQIESPGSMAYMVGRRLSSGEGIEGLIEELGYRVRELVETSLWLSRQAASNGVEAHITGAMERILSKELAPSLVLGELFSLKQMME